MSDTQSQPSILTRLKARYARNAASPDGARTRKAAFIGAFIGLALLGGYRFLQRDGDEPGTSTAMAEPGFTPGRLPACDAPVAKRLLKQAVEDNPSPILGAVKVHRIGQIVDYMALVLQQANDTSKPHLTADSVAEQRNQRSCMAQLFTSHGQHTYNYSMTFVTDAKDEVYLQAELGD